MQMNLPANLLTLGWPVFQLPLEFLVKARRLGVLPGKYILCVSEATQTMHLFEKIRACPKTRPVWMFLCLKQYSISTSGYGIGQGADSNQTPLGLHRIAAKVGGGYPIGTVFKHRKAVGLTWQGLPKASIVHRILWLEGLEPGFNRGGNVDTFRRYIYIHGFGDETTLGTRNSHGCIHVAASDLIPLYERLPVGTLVWITRTPLRAGRKGVAPIHLVGSLEEKSHA